MARANLEWIELTDFTPGIFSNNQLAGGLNVTSTNLALASPTNTHRCIALPSGGLGPLPRRRDTFGLTTIPDSGTYPTYKIAGFGSWGRILASPATDSSADLAELHIVMYAEVLDGATYDSDLWWVRERRFDTVDDGTDVLYNGTKANSGVSGPRFAYLLKTRMNPTTPSDPGTPVMVAVGARVGDNDPHFAKAFPDPANATTNTPIDVGDTADPYIIAAAHQGRVVFGRWQSYDHGVGASLVTNENILYTATNDNTLSTATPAQFVPEIDQTITDMASMSANQLFVVKWYGGGYVLTGDLDDVTVVRLPNLPCPDGSDYVRGCTSSKGYVYSAGQAGMYLWNGGDGAELISRQLEGDFAVGSNFITGANGQCDRWIDRVLVPQNWIWDSNMGSWWRIEDPSLCNIRFWSTLANASYAYGAEESFTVASPDFMHEFRYDDLAYTYSWQSHPIWISRDRQMEVRQGTCALQGHGQVTITVFDVSDDTNLSQHVIDIDSDVIQNYRWDVGIRAQNLAVRIEASGDNGDGPGTYQAPLTHRVFLGWAEAAHLGNANN